MALQYDQVCLAILAAGSSRRFGDPDKLAADFDGRPLGTLASAALADVPFHIKLVVMPAHEHACANDWQAQGYDLVINPRAVAGMAGSIAVAARYASGRGAMALLVCLADMPFVDAALADRIIATANGADDRVATRAPGVPLSPPALFGRKHFAALTELRGDGGARSLLQGAKLVDVPARALIDIDTMADLERLRS